MKEKMDQLLHMILKYDASDVHFIRSEKIMTVMLRTMNGMEEIHMAALDEKLFNYLKFIADMDLGASSIPQSGNFHYTFQGVNYDFRFSCIHTMDKETGVLRILNNHDNIKLEDLSYDADHYRSFVNWTKTRSGLVVLSGPTGSGKTTTLHAILSRIAKEHHLNVVSLEDPVEIYDDHYLQLQINEKNNFTYEEGIRQLMRHDPDVIMIGEIRDPITARMLLRSALSGHMIFTTIHAKCCTEAVRRLNEFGLSDDDLKHTLSAVCSQRLYPAKGTKRRECIYEILENDQLRYYFEHHETPAEHADITQEIKKAIQLGKISENAARYDLPH